MNEEDEQARTDVEANPEEQTNTEEERPPASVDLPDASPSAGQGQQEAIPAEFIVGQDIDWNAPWIGVELDVELPFWLMVNDGPVNVGVNNYSYEVVIQGNYWELHFGGPQDSRASVVYVGPKKSLDDFGPHVQEAREQNPDVPFFWRKCKTVLRISTRCNADVWSRGGPIGRAPSVSLYLAELCRAHIPVINHLIQSYRLATYDYFPFEISPWDVPHWWVRRDSDSIPVDLLPYKTWDVKPMIVREGEDPVTYQLIDLLDLSARIDPTPTPGELELLDALSLMERGDYSGAVRRVTTAIEVVVEATVAREVEQAEGAAAAKKFIRDTRTNFPRRVSRYQKLTGRTMSAGLKRELDSTRKLRHQIVHGGYRISAGERGDAQRSVDTGRWIFNWFENETARRDIRERRIAFRGLGRDISYGVFPSQLGSEGVELSPPPRAIG